MYLNEYNIRGRRLPGEKPSRAYFCQNSPRLHGGQAPSFNTLACIINALSNSAIGTPFFIIPWLALWRQLWLFFFFFSVLCAKHSGANLIWNLTFQSALIYIFFEWKWKKLQCVSRNLSYYLSWLKCMDFFFGVYMSSREDLVLCKKEKYLS